MVYSCIGCQTKWATNGDDINEQIEISHGLCQKCFSKQMIKIYRKKQLDEGNFDCYGKFITYCDQLDCKYRQYCYSVNH